MSRAIGGGGGSMAASKKSMANSLPQAMYSPLTSNALQGQSSLTSAVKNASEAAESRQAEEEEEEEEEVAEAEREDQERKPSLLNKKNGKRGGESKSANGSEVHFIDGGIEGGLSSQWSRVDSQLLGNIFEEDETASCSDSEPFKTSELELIEAALASLRNVEGDTEGSEAAEQQNLSSAHDQQDMQGVARLLKKVQAVKARRIGDPLKQIGGGSFRQGPSGEEDMEPADIRLVVQAAAETALAAAKSVETVVSSLNRNSQAMESLCKVLTRSSDTLHLPVEDTAREMEELEDEEEEGSEGSNAAKFLALELQQTEIAKSLVRQNRVTHWVLGFIVVSSLIWRFGVVKFVKQVNNTIQNPFQGITDMFFNKSETEDAENEVNFPRFKLPKILTGEEEGEKQIRQVEKHKKEENMFNLGSIFPTEEPQTSESKEGNRQANQGRKDDKDPNPGQDSNRDSSKNR